MDTTGTASVSNANGTFHNPSGATNLLSKLNEQRVNGTACDFCLISGTFRQPVHRCLARAISPVIDEAVGTSPTETDVTSYTFDSISSETLIQLVDYIYTSTVVLTPQTAVELHTVATQLRIDFLDEVTMAFLRNCINPNNCVSILNHAVAHNCLRLRAECILSCATDYEDLIQNPEFGQIQPAEFLEIVSHPELGIQDEHVLFDSIKRWLAFAPTDRDQYASQLSESVRFQLFQVDRLLDLLQDPQNKAFHPQMRRALIDFGALARPIATEKWERKNPRKRDAESENSIGPTPAQTSPNTKSKSTNEMTSQSISQLEPRPPNQSVNGSRQLESSTIMTMQSFEEKPVESEDPPSYVLAVFGGRSSEKKLLRDILCYRVQQALDTQSGQLDIELKLLGLNSTPALPNARKGFGASSVWDQAFLIGGQPSTLSRTVDVYDVHQDEWLVGPPLNKGRAWHGVAQSGDVLFAVGGSGKEGVVLADGEMLDLRAGEWHPIPSMNEPRMSLACCVANQNLYAVGGVNQSTVEALDLRAWRWRTVFPMDDVRGSPAVGQCEDAVYVFGGSTASGPLDSTIRFLPATGKWEKVKPIPKACAFSAFVTKGQYVFVIGGRDACETLATIQLYDMKNDQWFLVPETLPIARSSSCALIFTDV